MYISPTDIVEGYSTNLNLTCDARGQSANMTLVTLMQLSKVMADGSLHPLVELISGSQEPLYTDTSFKVRSHASGSLKVRQDGAYLKVEVPESRQTDAGSYVCSMTYLDLQHGLGFGKAEGVLKG